MTSQGIRHPSNHQKCEGEVGELRRDYIYCIYRTFFSLLFPTMKACSQSQSSYRLKHRLTVRLWSQQNIAVLARMSKHLVQTWHMALEKGKPAMLLPLGSTSYFPGSKCLAGCSDTNLVYILDSSTYQSEGREAHFQVEVMAVHVLLEVPILKSNIAQEAGVAASEVQSNSGLSCFVAIMKNSFCPSTNTAFQRAFQPNPGGSCSLFR